MRKKGKTKEDRTVAILSNAVNAGDDILASQYNNLRTDLLTGDIAIAGIKSFSDDLYIAATKKLYLDGGGGSNTYITESANDTIDFYSGLHMRVVLL